MRKRILGLAILLFTSPSFGGEPVSTEDLESAQYRSSAIDYFRENSTDVITRLKTRIERGEVTLRRRDGSGYLLDLLAVLDVPLASQTLVFSRSSFQEQLISPKTPRAIYFNDEVAIAWIPGSPFIEIAAQDPLKGALFFTLPQSAEEVPAGKIAFHRDERCLECHVSPTTLNVPGYLLRSFQVDEFGERDLQAEFAEVTHAVPFAKRWGGWYVTGSSKKMVHAGNLFGDDDANRHEQDSSFRGTMTDLASLVDLTGYPSSQSDIVALSVLDHQMRFYNLVTRVQYDQRLGIQSDSEAQLAKYALMEDEAPMAGPIAGSTDYTTWYQSVRSRDPKGRTLRDLNLKTRLFEHRLSPLVRSRSFQSLPKDVKARLWVRFQKARGDIAGLDSLEPTSTLPQSFRQRP